MSLGVIGNTSGFGPEEYRFDPCRDNNFSGCSVARLSRHVWDVEAAGSNPATPTF